MSLLRFFRRRNFNNDHDIVSIPIIDQLAKRRIRAQTSPLLHLPTEVLLQIYENLDVGQHLLLARTCHLLRQLTVLQHNNHELPNLQDADWHGYKKLLRKEQCYTFLKERSRGIIPSGSSVCGRCLAIHPDCWFTADQLKNGPFKRVCRAWTTPIKVCEHKHIFYKDIEDMRANEYDYVHICTQHASRDSGGVHIYLRRAAPSNGTLRAPAKKSHKDQLSIPRFILFYDFNEYVFKKPDLKDRPIGEWLLCPHINLSKVVQALHPKARDSQRWLLCGQCNSCFCRPDGNLLQVMRDLGQAGDVPDAPWAAAINLEPISSEGAG